jgi:hypothetical protein
MVVVPARYGNLFLCSLKGLKIRALKYMALIKDDKVKL